MANLKDHVWHRALKQPYLLKKVIDQGNSDKIIILIHGLGAKSEYWRPLYSIIPASKYRVIAYDLLGFGSSPQPAWLQYSVAEHTKSLIKSLRKDIPKNSKVVLLGHSMGCIIASHLSSKRPSMVGDVILYQPPLLVDSKLQAHKKFYAYIATRPAMLNTYTRLIGRSSAKLTSMNLRQTSQLAYERSLKNTILAQRTIDELKVTFKPTHIVYGRLDFVVSKIHAKKFAAINPNIKLHYVNEMHNISVRSAKYLKNLIETL